MRLYSLLIAAALALTSFVSQASANDQSTRTNEPIVLAQAAEATFRVTQLEEQVRSLNGRIEELTFQLLQLQEQIRKMQEDNEFRFQELEQRGDASGSSSETDRPNRKSIGDLIQPDPTNGSEDLRGKSEPSEQSAGTDRSGGNAPSQQTTRRTIDGVEIYEGPSGQDTRPAGQLGEILVDENGNPIGLPPQAPLQLGGEGQQSNLVPEALPRDADGLYELGYSYIQAGDYGLAQDTFLTFIDQYPSHPRSPDVYFWLGESHFSQGNYEQAAEVFLDAHRQWPEARFGPQTLLKLGVSLAGLKQRELACATYAEVKQKYPNASSAVRNSVAAEQKAAQCVVN